MGTFKFNTKFENLLTSAGFMAMELCRQCDAIVTSYGLIGVQFFQ